jgi:hypothetical protein
MRSSGYGYPPRKECERCTHHSPVWFERNSMNGRQVGTCDKSHMSHYNNQTHSHVCLRTSPGVLTTCRIKWYVPTQVHQVLFSIIFQDHHVSLCLLLTNTIWSYQCPYNFLIRVLFVSIFPMLNSSEVTQLFPFKFHVIAPGQVQWIILSEFPECYLALISISLCINAQGLLLFLVSFTQG